MTTADIGVTIPVVTTPHAAITSSPYKAGVESPRFAVTTPELVTFRYRIAGVGTRGMAHLIDFALLLVLKIILVLIVSSAMIWNEFLIGVSVSLILILWLALDFGYYTLLEQRWRGQTIGKRVFRIRVASSSGLRLSGHDIFLRNLIRPVDSLPPLMVIGVIVATIDPYRRRLGDLAAGTVVIQDPRVTLPARVRRSASKSDVFEGAAGIKQRILSRVTREERDLFLDLAVRRDDLDPLNRERLFARVAAYARTRFNITLEDDHITDERLVLSVVLTLTDSREGGLPTGP